MSVEEQLVTDYINHRLGKSGFTWNTRRQMPREVTPVMRTLRTVADEFETRFTRTFDDLNNQLVITDDTAYSTFRDVVNELYAEGIKWGRIVALFSFAGKLGVQAMDRHGPNLVDMIARWATDYINTKLLHWIYQQGGWETFVEFYSSNPERLNEHPWPAWSSICGFAVSALRAIIQNS